MNERTKKMPSPLPPQSLQCGRLLMQCKANPSDKKEKKKQSKAKQSKAKQSKRRAKLPPLEQVSLVNKKTCFFFLALVFQLFCLAFLSHSQVDHLGLHKSL
ncbi:hypothetical protein M440DRAFT_1173830 [Trichoderma longibrachiatum ATCC 18648]|uniref:Uncharacterized protein n=1 Tax=Trichoderma longibrachiatum ATCC 18648 TaxID=983965 RepID=A0A2T4CDH4_TRILO|nr:hypothetical protein M440DRAFT_1173830 [Trichoderma longibrachiatum ATCC 18648]